MYITGNRSCDLQVVDGDTRSSAVFKRQCLLYLLCKYYCKLPIIRYNKLKIQLRCCKL